MTVPMTQPVAGSPTTTPDTAPPRRVRRRPTASTIEQAVALRDVLRTVACQAGDLAQSLKHQKRQARIVATTLASLKELQKVAG